jgi:glycosyltransferase involved in cell wall biosynthesis
VASSRVAVLSLVAPTKNGRVGRALNALRLGGKNPLVCAPQMALETADVVPLKTIFGRSEASLSAARFLARVLLLVGFMTGQDLMRVGRFVSHRVLGAKHLSPQLRGFDGPVLVEEILLLPAALSLRPRRRVVLDVRDLFHRLFDNRWFWRITFGRALTAYLAKTMPLCDAVFTVTEGIAEQIFDDFGVRAEVVRSIPDSTTFPTQPIQHSPINVVYTGRADSNRDLDKLVACAGGLAGHMNFHMYLVGHRKDIRQLRRGARNAPNVFFHEPVAFDAIIPTLSTYDLGYAVLGSQTVNEQRALPNKFFEYIFAGIPVVVSQGSEMASVIKDLPLGIALDDSGPDTIANGLKALTREDIESFHAGITRAQKVFNWDEESKKLLAIIDGKTP